jgi:hypothetical protein
LDIDGRNSMEQLERRRVAHRYKAYGGEVTAIGSASGDRSVTNDQGATSNSE